MNTDNGLFLAFFLLLMIYAALFLFVLFRVVKLRSIDRKWNHAKLFYIVLQVQLGIRTCFMMTLISTDIEELWVFWFLTVPEWLFIWAFFMLYWLLITVYYYAYFDSDITQPLLENTDAQEGPKNTAKIILVIIAVTWFTAQTVFYFGITIGFVPMYTMSLEICVIDICWPILTIATIIYMNIKNSGRPVRSVQWKKRVKKVTMVIALWSLARLVKGILGYIKDFSTIVLTQFLYEFDHTQHTIPMMISILIYWGSEILCSLIVIDFEFIALFLFAEISDRQRLSQLNLAPDPVQINPLNKSRSPSITSTDDDYDLDMHDENIQFLNLIPGGRLGRMYLCKYKGQLAAIRVVIFKRVSSYVLEEFHLEIQALQKLFIPHLLPILEAWVDLPKIGIITPYAANGSLYQILHVQRDIHFSRSDKIRISHQIAIAIREVHAIGRSHGQLCSENILLDENWHVMVSNLGLLKIKKFAGITKGYTNKSAWSSPEILSQRTNFALVQNPSDDAFSFGVLLWEIFTQEIPFQSFSLPTLVETLVTNQYRLQIPEHLGTGLITLIKTCWNVNPEKRPTFDLICRTLQII